MLFRRCAPRLAAGGNAIGRLRPTLESFPERTEVVQAAAKRAGAAPLTEAVAKADFRAYCVERSADPTGTGVPVATFVQFLRDVRGSGRTTELMLRDMDGFVFDGPMLRLAPGDADAVPLAHEDDIAAFAAALPAEGLDADAAKAHLTAHHPAFTPKAVGCITVRDALARFPHLLRMESEGAGGWRVRRAGMATSSAPASSSSSPAVPDAPAMSEEEAAAALDVALLEAYNARAARRGGNDGRDAWEDVEPLLRLVPAHVRDAVKDLPATLAKLPSLEVAASPLMRPARRMRGVHLFVDGDGLTSLHLDVILSRMRVDVAASAAKVLRAAATPALTTDDAITPLDIPTYMAVEAAAQKLRRSEPIVLRDVIYACSDDKLELYADKVAHAVTFPDAEVWVVTPTRELCVASWKVAAEGAQQTSAA